MGSCQGLSLNDPRFTELDLAIHRYRERRDGILYVLERARYLFGTLPDTVLHRMTDQMAIAPGDLYQALAVEDLFASRPVGAHTVSVCLGTPCYLAGAGLLFDRLMAELGTGPGETTPDGLFTLKVCYAQAHPSGEVGFYIDDRRYVVPPEGIPAILDAIRNAEALVGSGVEG